MKAAGSSSLDVGVRELRQNLSVYLARLAEGVAYRVTDRGQPVGMLIPLPTVTTPVERLVASGRAAPATADLLALGPPQGKPARSASAALRQVRADRL